MPTLLHAGCGDTPRPAWAVGLDEVRLDIDRRCNPDIVANITSLGDIGPFDALYSSHCLEHLYPHQVPVALAEFLRVLKPGGKALIIVPDLEDVRPTEEALYLSEAGWICGLDMYYGKASLVAENPFMAHHCGFVAETLRETMEAAGFIDCVVMREPGFNLVAVGARP
jgi:ubiquinone/menaquinone biosynthesis C-methylase UbiE